MKKPFWKIVLLFAALTTCAAYTFFQRLELPVSEKEAETLLAVNRGPAALLKAIKSGQASLFEIPFYAIGKAVFGISPFAVITASALLTAFATLFGLVLLLSAKKAREDFVSLLCFFILTGFPNREILGLAQDRFPIALCVYGLALSLNCLENNRFPRLFGGCLGFFVFCLTRHSPLFAALSVLCAALAFPKHSLWVGFLGFLAGLFFPCEPSPQALFSSGILRALNDTQKLFKADFSGKTLLTLKTGCYLLFSVMMLLCAAAWVFCLRQWLKKVPSQAAVRFFCLAVPVFFTATSFFSETPAVFLTWFPTAGAIFLSEAWNRGSLKKLKIAEGQLPFCVPVILFLLLCFLFGAERLPHSRLETAEDRVTRELSAQGLRIGYAPADTDARLTAASKGKVTFLPYDSINKNSLLEDSEKGEFQISLKDGPEDEIDPWGRYLLQVFH